jgi:hypothetical protein
MSTESYKTALDEAIREYEQLGEQRREIDQRLAHLAQTIGTLSRLLGFVPTVPMGLTDAVRLVTRAGIPMTPTEVRDRLKSIGIDLTGYSSELSAIHTVLKRLNDSGEVRIVPKPNGKDAYLWQRPVKAIAISEEVADYIRQAGNIHTNSKKKKDDK